MVKKMSKIMSNRTLKNGEDYSGEELKELGFEIDFIQSAKEADRHYRDFYVVNSETGEVYRVTDVGNDNYTIINKVRKMK